MKNIFLIFKKKVQKYLVVKNSYYICASSNIY